MDSAGTAYLTGTTTPGFPVTSGAFQTTYFVGNYAEPFVAKINPSLAGAASLVYSTFVSTPNNNPYLQAPSAMGIAVDAHGDAFITGNMGPGLPLVNPVMSSANGVMQSVNAGQTWTGLTQGLTDFAITAMAVDASTSPRTLYAGTALGGIFSSNDGGISWSKVLQLPNSSAGLLCHGGNPGATCVFALAVDPTTPSNVFASTTAGIFRSQDRGATWSAFNAGFNTDALDAYFACLVFDNTPPTRDTLYAGAGDGLYILTPGATSWTSTNLGVSVENIAVDTTTTPHTLYTASELSAAYKSTDGGTTWTNIDSPGVVFSEIAVDVSTLPSTLYSYYLCAECSASIFKSMDAGNSWSSSPIPDSSGQDFAGTIAVDPSTEPSTVYVRDFWNGVFKSTDGGNTWSDVLPAGMGALALDPTTASPSTPATLYAGTSTPTANAFVAELDPTGSNLLFSTYLGGIASQAGGVGIAVDNSGNIYISGSTGPMIALVAQPEPILDYPTVNGFPATAPRGTAAFVTKLGSQTLPQSSPASVSTQVGIQTGLLTVTFPNISGSTTSSAPTLTVTPLSSAQSANFSLSDNLGAYDISTTASYSGSVTLCFQAQTVNDLATFNSLQLIHIVNGTPVNITISWNFPTRTICGTTNSFSPFILVKGALGQLQDIVRYVNESNLRHGIQSSLDSKLQNAESAFSSAIGHDYSSACNMTSAFINSVQAQAGQAITAAEATHMIGAAMQVKATIGCAH